MKRIVLTFGLIAGAILSIVMMATMPFHDQLGYDTSVVVGYSSMVIAFLMVFFGIRSYRDNAAGGHITFGRGFKVGIMITAIASLCYVVAWEVIYYTWQPDYLEKFAVQMVEKERAAGTPEAEIAVKQAEMAKFAELYKNPLVNAGFTLLEVLPVGIVMTAVSAGILRRRRGPEFAT
jgi:amino acid transporter